MGVLFFRDCSLVVYEKVDYRFFYFRLEKFYFCTFCIFVLEGMVRVRVGVDS